MATQTNKRGLARKILRIILKTVVYTFLFSLFYILFCKWINPPITITQIGSLIQGHGLHRQYVSFDEMNPNVKLAVMASEDQLFPDHNGFDFKSIQKAMKHNQKSKSLRGASTISQQVAKTFFFGNMAVILERGLKYILLL